jgi:mannose-6-phosphate isomerase, type 1 (EC 5.3.1.8)
MQKLINSVQNYAWGSKTALTDLYGIANPNNLPMAELWMGAHPKSSSKIADANGETRSLRDAIDADKAALLGEKVANRFGELPFLFKVLCADQPLSIQVHPNKKPPKLALRKKTRLAFRWTPPSVTTKILTTSRSWFSPLPLSWR